jgi:two-component system, sensor histidine kinase
LKIRTKTFIIIASLFVIAFFIMAFILDRFMSVNNNQLDIRNTRDILVRAMNIIETDQKDLENLVVDWAEWDDTYQYVKKPDPGYIRSNYDYSTFFNNRLNLSAIIDSQGNLINVQYYQWLSESQDQTYSLVKSDLPEQLRTYLAAGSPLLSKPAEISGLRGLVDISGHILMVASHSIVTTDGSSPIAGTLIIGRFLDSHELSRLYSTYNLQIEAFMVNAVDLPPDYSSALGNLEQGSATLVQDLSNNRKAGYALLTDIHGQPIGIFKIENDRNLFLQAQEDIGYFSLSLLVFGLLFIIVIWVVLEKLVISRISSLSENVNRIGSAGDLSARVALPGKDELSGLAANINTMLTSIEKSRQLQRESETFSSALLQDSPNPILVINPDASIRYVNPALEHITGYSEAQLINRKPPFPWWVSENGLQFVNDLKEIAAGGIQKQEKRFSKPDATFFWVETTTTSIQQDQQVKYYISSWVDITERKQAEVALKGSENRFRELAELLPELVFETNKEGNLIFVNRIVFNVFGYLNEESSHLKLTDLIAPEGRSGLLHNMRNIMDGETSGNTEYTALRKDGTRFPAFVHATPTRDELGEVAGLRGILVDITTQKHIESELRASEEFASSLLSNSPNPILVSNRDSSIRYINPALEKLTGYSSMDLIGKGAPYPWWIDAPPSLISAVNAEFEARNEEKCYRKKNGEKFWITLTNSPFIENGILQYFVGNWVDITERQKAETALKESEEFSSSLQDNSPYPIMVINPDNSIRYVNSALEKLSGFSASELIGRCLPYPFVNTADCVAESRILPDNILTSYKTETVLHNHNGESFYVSISSTPILKDNNLNYVLSIWIDITAQKIASEQLEKLYQREKNLREELQVEIRSRTEFTRALVHELKTPLTPIMASSELLVEELTTEPLLGLARNVHRGAENMNRRVDEMLDLARGDVGMLKVNINPVDIVRILKETYKYMEPLARSNGQALTIDVPEKLPIILADDDRVRQVLFNLINNSVKYSLPGGKIRISAQVVNHEMVVAVEDTGRGMSTTDQEKLFQPYYRIEGREHLSGLGLGLALSKKLVELQNGRIWVVSQKGQGSTFSFTLPLKTDDNI